MGLISVQVTRSVSIVGLLNLILISYTTTIEDRFAFIV